MNGQPAPWNADQLARQVRRAALLPGAAELRITTAPGAIGWAWLEIAIIPIYWIVITTLKSRSSYFAANPFKPPTSPTLKNYRPIIHNDFGR